MSKLEELRRTAGQNVKDSAGADRADQPGPDRRRRRTGAWRGVERSRDMALIPVAKIDRDPDQPRQEFDEEELAAGRVAANQGAAPADPRAMGRGQGDVRDPGRRTAMASGADGWRGQARLRHPRGRPRGGREARHATGRERPAHRPQAGRAGQGIPASDGRQGLLDPGPGRRAAHRPDLGRPGAGAPGSPRRGSGPRRGGGAGRHRGRGAGQAPRC